MATMYHREQHMRAILILLAIVLCLNAPLAVGYVSKESGGDLVIRSMRVDDTKSMHTLLGDFDTMKYVEYSNIGSSKLTALTREEFARNLRAAIDAGKLKKFKGNAFYDAVASQTVQELAKGYDSRKEGCLGYILQSGWQAVFLFSDTHLSRKFLENAYTGWLYGLPELFYAFLKYGSSGGFAYPFFRTAVRVNSWVNQGQLVVCKNDKLIGFISTNMIADVHKFKGRNCISIMIVVEKTFRQQGIARLLWKHALATHPEWRKNPDRYSLHITSQEANTAVVQTVSKHFGKGTSSIGIGSAKRVEWYIPLEKIMEKGCMNSL